MGLRDGPIAISEQQATGGIHRSNPEGKPFMERPKGRVRRRGGLNINLNGQEKETFCRSHFLATRNLNAGGGGGLLKVEKQTREILRGVDEHCQKCAYQPISRSAPKSKGERWGLNKHKKSKSHLLGEGMNPARSTNQNVHPDAKKKGPSYHGVQS